jgi:hypothetical protein
MQLAVPAQPDFLVDRAGCRAQKQNSKNPNESVEEQLPSPLPCIATEICHKPASQHIAAGV